MTDRERVEEITKFAREALAATQAGDVDSFVAKVELYLSELESWQKEASQSNPLSESSQLSRDERAELKSSVDELNAVHQQLMGSTEETKDDVGHAIGEMHRRASGLRKYVDTLPKRLSVTGKREG